MQPVADKRSGKRKSMRRNSGNTESGTCNVCSAPCSSCMHLKLGYMAKGSEVCDETYHSAAVSQNSINDNQQCTASETSNHVSVDSSHDSMSENAESNVEGQPFNNFGDSKTEGLGDDTSCVSKVHDDRAIVSYCRKSGERKISLGKSDTIGVLDHKGCDKLVPCAADDASSPATDNCDTCISAEAEADKEKVRTANKLWSEFDAEDKRGGPSEDHLNHANEVGEEKGLLETHNVHDSAMKSIDESGESDVVEHDVKVCDICGDAGREDLLAICSRCTDGAEHTYCMREMLQKVPEGNWLCEECKLIEDNDKQRQEEAAKSSKENVPKCGKKHVERPEKSSSKQKDTETSSEIPASSKSDRKTTLSRESSFKIFDKEKTMIADPSPSLSQSLVDLPGTSNAYVARLQHQRGILSKSNSFSVPSSKMKGNLGDEVLQKVKSGEYSTMDMKDAPAPKGMSKSMSFKSVNSSRGGGSEAKVRMLPAKFSFQEVKRLKPITDRSTSERKTVSKMDHPKISSKIDGKNDLTPRADGNLKQSLSKNKELNAVRMDGKPGNLPRSSSFMTRKSNEILPLQGRTPLSNDLNSSTDSRLCQASPKDEPSSSSSWVADRVSNNENENSSACLPKQRDSMIPTEKSKESFGSRLGPSGSRNSIETCEKCNEVGHTAGHCKKSGRGNASGDCKLKAAIEAAMLKKPEIYRRKRESELADGVSSSNVDGRTHDAIPIPNKKEPNCDEEAPEARGNTALPSFDSPKESSDVGAKQSTPSARNRVQNGVAESNLHVKVEDSDSTTRFLGPSELASLLPSFAIPDHDYLWQGAFEVCRTGGYVEWIGGIQAHLSSFASPKVLEVVKQFPRKLILDEVPRNSAWPSQFHLNGAKEENIALFFFAKDIQSYERHYKGLLANTIKNDLTLKGSIDSVDLLIYPSVQLPEKSQRWNMLYFLWGVFRGRKSDCVESSKKSVTTESNTQTADKEASTAADEKYDAETEGKQAPPEDNTESFAKDGIDKLSACREACSKDSEDGERPPAEIRSLQSVKVETNLNENPQEMDLNVEETERWHDSSHKRQFIDLSEDPLETEEAVAHDSSGVAKRSKLDLLEPPASSSSFMAESSGNSAAIFNEVDKRGRFFFPMETQTWKEHRPDTHPQFVVPNLELALGAETAAGSREALHLFGVPERSSRYGKSPETMAEKDDDDVASPSLSLSLAFPFGESKSKGKGEEKSNVNTSLFLFRGFSDK